jgi:hypothetical protein
MLKRFNSYKRCLCDHVGRLLQPIAFSGLISTLTRLGRPCVLVGVFYRCTGYAALLLAVVHWLQHRSLLLIEDLSNGLRYRCGISCSCFVLYYSVIAFRMKVAKESKGRSSDEEEQDRMLEEKTS